MQWLLIPLFCFWGEWCEFRQLASDSGFKLVWCVRIQPVVANLDSLPLVDLKSQDTSKNSAGPAHILQFSSLKKELMKNLCFASTLLCVYGIFFDVWIWRQGTECICMLSKKKKIKSLEGGRRNLFKWWCERTSSSAWILFFFYMYRS